MCPPSYRFIKPKFTVLIYSGFNIMRPIAIFFTLLIAASSVLPGQGVITTMAGVQFASCGPRGDGGPATSAQLCGAQSPAIDASGNIYFFDYGNARIRK